MPLAWWHFQKNQVDLKKSSRKESEKANVFLIKKIHLHYECIHCTVQSCPWVRLLHRHEFSLSIQPEDHIKRTHRKRTHCLSSFPTAVMKCPGKVTEKRKGYLDGQSQSPAEVGNTGQQVRKACERSRSCWWHFTPTSSFRKQRRMSWFHCLSLLTESGPQADLPIIKRGLLILLIKTIPTGMPRGSYPSNCRICQTGN